MRRLIRGGGGRDLRVDFFRGVALWFIFIDHVPGNALGSLTLRNLALCDATEAFVLLAGYAAGLAYGASMDRLGWGLAAAQLARRVGTLYVAHIFLFVVFTAQVGLSAATLDSAAYLDELHLDAFGEQPYRALLEALLLRFQPAFLDILPLYIVLLALLLLGAAALWATWLSPELTDALPEHVAAVLIEVDKTALHPFRLISMLALAYLLGHAVPIGARWLRGAVAAPFVLLGQHGLPVFCAGIALSFLGRLALEVSDRWAMQAAVNLAGLLALVAVGVVAAWFRLRSRGTAAPAPPDRRPAGVPLPLPDGAAAPRIAP